MLRFHRLFLLSSFLFLSGCATFRSPDQVISVNSSPPGADIFVNGKKVGTTPDLVKIDRKFHQKLEVRDGARSKNISMYGGYRFKGSFWPNLAFLTLAPVGWVVDIATGSAWEFDSHYDVSFDGKTTKKSKAERLKLAIAPPQSDYSMLSDELGEKLESHLRDAFPQYDIIPYKNSMKIFARDDFDYDRSKSAKPWPDVFYDSKADVVFASRVQIEDDMTRVTGQVFDGYSEKPSDEKKFQFPKEKISTMSKVEGYENRPVYFYVLPNTVAADFEDSTTGVSVNDKDYSSKPQSSDDFWGKVSRYLSVVALRRYQPPVKDKVSHWRLTFIPSLTLSHSKQKFEESPELRDLEFTLSHIDASYGPQYTFFTGMWSFYGGLAGALGYDQLKIDDGIEKKSYGKGNLGVSFEAGATYFFTPKWSVRFALRSVSSNPELWKKAITDSTGQNYRVDSPTVKTAGFSIGYTFSDYIHPGRRE